MRCWGAILGGTYRATRGRDRDTKRSGSETATEVLGGPSLANHRRTRRAHAVSQGDGGFPWRQQHLGLRIAVGWRHPQLQDREAAQGPLLGRRSIPGSPPREDPWVGKA